ncbi:VanZ family protein [Microbacterium betulae]|uniref:VanZ family protein n=1 Tax=Microbacterium betulae TaxID=2981139 RepID=A0AA97FHM8_9MICO|nr:VanZ family protein [Microbacterium sp. AB]WOF22254.1 VanZ family protein [Microbacterium sp. AB]
MSELRGTRPPRSHARSIVAGTLLAAYTGAILLATMWPTPMDRGYSAAIEDLLGVLHRSGLPYWFGYRKLEFAANVAMFAPFGFLIGLVMPARAVWTAWVLIPVFSAAIELLQGALLAERFASPFDVLANTVGGYIGIFLVAVIRRVISGRDRKMIAGAIWDHEVRRQGARVRQR